MVEPTVPTRLPRWPHIASTRRRRWSKFPGAIRPNERSVSANRPPQTGGFFRLQGTAAAFAEATAFSEFRAGPDLTMNLFIKVRFRRNEPEWAFARPSSVKRSTRCGFRDTGVRAMHKNIIVVASLLVLAASSAPAWAGWGCGAHRTDGGNNRNFGFASRSAAARDLQQECSTTAACGPISCKRGVNHQAQGMAVWPQLIPGQIGYTPRELAMGCPHC